jgi:hypothetical protein
MIIVGFVISNELLLLLLPRSQPIGTCVKKNHPFVKHNSLNRSKYNATGLGSGDLLIPNGDQGSSVLLHPLVGHDQGRRRNTGRSSTAWMGIHTNMFLFRSLRDCSIKRIPAIRPYPSETAPTHPRLPQASTSRLAQSVSTLGGWTEPFYLL